MRNARDNMRLYKMTELGKNKLGVHIWGILSIAVVIFSYWHIDSFPAVGLVPFILLNLLVKWGSLQ